MSPNRSQLSPLKRISCNCESGAKSVGEVLTLTPGKKPKGSKLMQASQRRHQSAAGDAATIGVVASFGRSFASVRPSTM